MSTPTVLRIELTEYTQRVDGTPDSRVGEMMADLMRMLVNEGASNQVLGRVVMDYPAMLAAKLEPLPPPPPPSPVIDADLVRAIVKEVVAATGGAPSRRRESVSGRAKVNVVVDGKRTSVKVRSQLLDNLESAGPDIRAEAVIQGFVDQAPAGHPNRSAWVEEQAMQFLVLRKLDVAQAPGH